MIRKFAPYLFGRLNGVATDFYNGVGGFSAPTGAGGDIKVATLALNDAQIKSLNSVPVQIIAAPGSNIYTVVLGCFVVKDTSAGAYNTASNFSLRYSGVTVDLTSPMSLFQASANYRWQLAAMANIGTTSVDSNKAVVAYQAADLTSGNASNYYKIIAVYTLFDVS